MRYGTAEQLRRRGYGAEDLRQLTALRVAVEEYLRGDRDRASVQALVDEAAQRPWFPLAYVDRQLRPVLEGWPDMDFDPEPTFARVRCPVLAFYGEADEWVPIDDSIVAWKRAVEVSGNDRVDFVRLPGCDHLPTHGGDPVGTAVSPLYTRIMLTWLDDRFA